MAIPEERRFAFTLKLSNEVILKGLASSKGFTGFMQDRIARFLRNALPKGHPVVNFVIVLEAWRQWEKPHVQGAIELEDTLPFGTYGMEIKKALEGAGGKLEGRSRSTQLDDKQMYEAARWFAYLGKRRMVTQVTLAHGRSSSARH
jgi:hypothetical protein